MTHVPGDRIAGGARGDYVVVGDGWTTARYEYRRARKRFRNFKYPADALVEADIEEALDVLLRRATTATSAEDLGRELATAAPFAGSGWFLEPVDVLDDEGTPLLVLADSHAERLVPGRVKEEDSAYRIERLLREFLGLLEMLHAAGLRAGPFSADDFLLDPTGRWFFLGTDLIAPARPTRSKVDDLADWDRLALTAGATPIA